MRNASYRSQFVQRREASARWTLTALWALVLVALAVAGTCAPAAHAAEHGIPPQAQVAAAGGVVSDPLPVSLNAQFRAFSLAQGVPTGSAAWLAGGDELQPSDTGGHAAYGWTHEHLLSASWVRACLANYAARPVYYDHAPLRLSSYFVGCRPSTWVWTTEVNSVANGGTMIGGVTVCGFDLEHFPLSPLFAVANSRGYIVPKPGVPGGVPARTAARVMVRYLMAAQAGMLRTPGGGLSTYIVHDRPARYIIGNLVSAQAIDAIDSADAVTLHTYIRTRLLPHWSLPPADDPGKGGDLQVYNGPAWAIPALYDLAIATAPGAYRHEIVFALEAQCRKLALLQSLVPGKACTVEKVSTWYGLTADGVTTLPYLGAWEVRSMLVAGKVLGAPACTAEGLAEAAKWKSDPAQRAWLVDADGVPLTWN